VQLNIYVPKERRELLMALDRAALHSGRHKNDLVLEALERYLPDVLQARLGCFSLGPMSAGPRARVYEARLWE